MIQWLGRGDSEAKEPASPFEPPSATYATEA